jgi:hypothetical protein
MHALTVFVARAIDVIERHGPFSNIIAQRRGNILFEEETRFLISLAATFFMGLAIDNSLDLDQNYIARFMT